MNELMTSPERWQKTRFAQLFVENSQKNAGLYSINAFQFTYGEIVPKPQYELTEALKLSYEKYIVVEPGDIMLNGLNLNYDFVTQRVGLVRNPGIITSTYICIRPRVKAVPKYYAYLFKTIDARKIFNGMGTGIRRTLSYDCLKNYMLPYPECVEQEQIVQYLDWRLSEINHLINLKKKEIKNVLSLKNSAVSDAVIHGVTPNTPMKYSGVKWLGDIPAHWTMIKLRQILHPISVKNHPELPLLSVTREQGVIVRNVESKEENHNYIPDDLSGYKVVHKGQFAMNKMKAWQGSYGISGHTGIVSPAYFIFDVDFDNLEYFHFAIRSKVYVNFFAQASDGIRVGQWDLQMDKMKEIPFIIPPADEQIAIVEHVREAMPKYDALIAKLNEEIKLLEEYKAKLISDVVTGKIDVRNVEIPEYEYIGEEIDSGVEEEEDAEE